MQLDRARQTNRVGGTFGMRRAQIARGVSPYVFADEFACENRHSFLRERGREIPQKNDSPCLPFPERRKGRGKTGWGLRKRREINTATNKRTNRKLLPAVSPHSSRKFAMTRATHRAKEGDVCEPSTSKFHTRNWPSFSSYLSFLGLLRCCFFLFSLSLTRAETFAGGGKPEAAACRPDVAGLVKARTALWVLGGLVSRSLHLCRAK